MWLFKRYGILLALTVLLVTASSWGYLVHRSAQQLAVYELPGTLRMFFYLNMDTLVYHSVRPDIRRGTDTTEATKHFIDLEMYGDSANNKMPIKWEDAVNAFSRDSLLKYGYVPYHIVHMKQKLTEAFRNRNLDSILFYAADIGHYIGDANVPLHTSVNYDGQLTDQKGLHSLWESIVPELELSTYQLTSRHKATYLANPAKAIMEAVQHAHSLLPAVFEKEKEVAKNFSEEEKYHVQMRRGRESKSYSSAFAKAYAKELAPMMNDQLIKTADLIADFWYTSWVDGGKPDLVNTTGLQFTNETKVKLEKELQAFRKNTLIENDMLIAKKRSNAKIEE